MHVYTTHAHKQSQLYPCHLCRCPKSLRGNVKFDHRTETRSSPRFSGDCRSAHYPSSRALAFAHAADTCARTRPPEILPTNFIYQKLALRRGILSGMCQSNYMCQLRRLFTSASGMEQNINDSTPDAVNCWRICRQTLRRRAVMSPGC